jgi:hypothetical protein
MIGKNRGNNGGYKNNQFGKYYQYLVKVCGMEEMKAITELCAKLARLMFVLGKKKE